MNVLAISKSNVFRCIERGMVKVGVLMVVVAAEEQKMMVVVMVLVVVVMVVMDGTAVEVAIGMEVSR